MFSIELKEVLGALMQLGLAVSGGSSFFSGYFLWKSRRGKYTDENRCIAASLKILCAIGLAIFFLAWAFRFLDGYLPFVLPVSAHEGITVERTADILYFGQKITFWPIVILFVVNVFALSFYRRREPWPLWLYGVNVALIGFIMFFINSVGVLNVKQVFMGMHGIHSIWTLGAATVVDYIYLRSLKKPDKEQAATYLSFPVITKFIWVGLAMDGIAAIGSFREHLEITPKFLFMQTVVAILIINGVFLTKKIGLELTRQAEGGGNILIDPRLSLGAVVSGSISIVSWYTITIIDYFENIALSYPQFLAAYVAVILAAILSGYLFESRAEMC